MFVTQLIHWQLINIVCTLWKLLLNIIEGPLDKFNYDQQYQSEVKML